MKTYLSIVLVVAAVSVMFTDVQAQEYHATIRKELAFTGSVPHRLNIWNINGTVTVEAYNGSNVQIEARETVKADQESYVQRGVKELSLKTEENGSAIDIYIDAPFVTIRHDGEGISYNICGDSDRKYHFNFDITVKVPAKLNVRASTINNGDVRIKGVDGVIEADNVNGAIHLEHITGETHARTVNGGITATFLAAPGSGSGFQTVNGDIRVSMPGNLSADLTYDTMNGDLYTNYDDVHMLPAKLKVDKNSSLSVTRYKINKSAPLRIGNGGPQYRFHTLNGNIYVSKQN